MLMYRAAAICSPTDKPGLTARDQSHKQLIWPTSAHAPNANSRCWVMTYLEDEITQNDAPPKRIATQAQVFTSMLRCKAPL